MEIKWSKSAVEHLDKALDFITEAGYISYAARFEQKIIARIESLIENHDMYPVDKYKKDNDVVIVLLKSTNIVSLIGLRISR